jgi:hypothetical protein
MAPALLRQVASEGTLRSASQAKSGGVDRDRTDDLKLAKLALSQLSYDPVLESRLAVSSEGWPSQAKAGLPTEAADVSPAFAELAAATSAASQRRLVGPGGVEPPTSRLSGVRSNHLSYEPRTSDQCPAISDQSARACNAH